MNSSEITLTSSIENLAEANNKGSIQHSTVPSAEEPSEQIAQLECDYGDGNTTAGNLHRPWSPSLIPSTVDPSTRCSSPEPMTVSENSRPPSTAGSFREPKLSWLVAVLLLTLVTVVSTSVMKQSSSYQQFLQTVSITAEDLVESMDGISTIFSKQWVGLILLPAVSSIAGTRNDTVCWCTSEHVDFAECVTAVNVSVKDQLNLSVSVAVGSSIVSPFHFPFR